MSVARPLAGWVATWVVLAGLWLVVTDSPKLPELLTGAVVVALAATASERVRRQRDTAMRLPAHGLRRAWRPLARVPADLARVTAAVCRQLVAPRPRRGRVRAMPFRHGGDGPAELGRRALAEGLGSFAPNTIVIGVDDRRDLILVHQLEPSGDAASELDPLGLR
jgi:multisubunit Na+/H+ antiporter MnhE subunit